MRIALILAAFAALATPVKAEWRDILDAARGQVVYWNAWGGDARTNAFIAWAGRETERRFDVEIRHVKLASTSEAVARVVSEKAAGLSEGGSVDLIWLNGPNFLAMKSQGLLHGPFVADMPAARFLDLTEGAPATLDFTEPVEGMESPWRLAKFVFIHDSEHAPNPPRSMAEMPAWAAAHPGRLTHPQPSDFMGATFLKQALLELAPDQGALLQPVTEESFAAATAPLWAWYDELRPHLWRGGESFPASEPAQMQLLSDGEVDIAMSFDPASAAAGVASGLLPESARVYAPEGGSIGNVSFVAIPFNAAHKEGAVVVANFLLEPATQAHMQNIDVLGSFSVLDHAKLDAEAKAAFDALPTAPALPAPGSLGETLPEPHASWMTRLTEEWARRYTK